MAIKLLPDAKFTITQPCGVCQGTGATDVRTSCSACGHRYTQEDLAVENEQWNAAFREAANKALDEFEPPATQLCGCDWHNREEDDHCVECDGAGKIALTVTLRELAPVIAAILTDEEGK